MPSAWDLSTGSPTAAVAVIDSGVVASHPDLREQMVTNSDERAGNGIDDDRNGYVALLCVLTASCHHCTHDERQRIRGSAVAA